MTIYERKQWVNWEIRTKMVGGKEAIIKYPLQGLKAPDTWMTYQEAKVAGGEVGFWFIESDPYFFLDIDHCFLEIHKWSDLATGLCSRFAGCYIEVSQSGTGLHIVGRGQLPPHKCKNSKMGLELYDRDRFIAWTGVNACGNPDFEMGG